MLTLLLALEILLTGYTYNTTTEFIEMSGHAINEAYCLEWHNAKPIRESDEIVSPSCVAYCNAALEWYDRTEINNRIGTCEDVIGAN